MPTLIDTKTVINDSWSLYDGSANNMPANADLLLPIEEFANSRALWQQHSQRIGLILLPTDDPQRIAPWLADLTMLSIDFPKFVDGRGMSIARILRTRYGFGGDIRAVGEVIPDQVPMLARCGFNQFLLSREDHAATALKLLHALPPHYQACVFGPAGVPLPGQARDAALARAAA